MVRNPVYAPTVSSPSVTVRLYRVGEPGDHSFGFSTLNWKAELADPDPVAMLLPVSSYTFTETESEDSEEEWTVILTDSQLGSHYRGLLTLAVHICRYIEGSDMTLGDGLKPDSLPDSSTGCVEDMRWSIGLLSDWYHQLYSHEQ